MVLGILVTRVTGRPYYEFLRERIFTPAGMPTIRIITEADVVPHRAHGYLPVAGGWEHATWVAPRLNTTADGSMLLSLRDMIAWNETVRTRRVLRPEHWELMLSATKLSSGKPYPYGFGWFLGEAGGQPMQEHGGTWQGFVFVNWDEEMRDPATGDERELMASSRALNRGYMECRGIGIINVGEMFGVKSIRLEKRIDLVVSLRNWTPEVVEERTGLEENYYNILGVKVPHIEFYVRPGRDIARLVEVVHQAADGEVVRPEIVSPLGNTVRFINSYKRNFYLTKKFNVLFFVERLGCYI